VAQQVRPPDAGGSHARKEETPAGRRRAYRSPTITEYGSVAKMTQGTATTVQNDFFMSGMRMMCL
jgi:hypothetical protein